MTFTNHGTVAPAWQSVVYDGRKLPDVAADHYAWSNALPLPMVGDYVRVAVNACGTGVVTGYFTDGIWIGVIVRLSSPPEWYVRQNGPDALAHAFGAELNLVRVEEDDRRLVHKASGLPVFHGEALIDAEGERRYVKGGRPPHKAGSSGRVWVANALHDDYAAEYYPHVFGLEWQPFKQEK